MSVKRVLYGFPPGNTTLIPLLAAQEAGVDIELKTVNIRKNEHKDPAYIANLHPLGKIPSYGEYNEAGEQTFSMIESRAIARYFNQLSGGKLGPDNTPHDIAVFEQFAYYEATSVTPIVGKIMVERLYGPMFGRPGNPEVAVKAGEEIRPFLQVLNRQLQKPNHSYICGEKFTLVDIQFFCVFKFVELHAPEWSIWEEFPELISWFKRVNGRPCFAKIDYNFPKQE